MLKFLSDLKLVLRQLRNSLGFAITAILMLALGIGATTAIFSIVESVLLRPLPFPDSDRLMVLSDHLEGIKIAGGGDEVGVTVPDILAYTRDAKSFSALGAYQGTGFELSGNGEPAQVNASRLTASVFCDPRRRSATRARIHGRRGRASPAARGSELCHVEEPLPQRSADRRKQGPARPQAVHRHRRHAARL